MKKKIIIFTLVATLICMLLPNVALAATHTVSDGQTLNLTTGEITRTDNNTDIRTVSFSLGDIIQIEAGATVTLTGFNDKVIVECGAGVTLTLQNAQIDNRMSFFGGALYFTGAGNTLILMGTSSMVAGMFNSPGVEVKGATELTIQGTGTLNVTGGQNGAGIGGGISSSGGTITINDGIVIATGGENAAGIGGGQNGAGGTITINGGNVTAIGGNYGAGIGGGAENDGGTLTINNGTVTAAGGGLGAGIGGGWNGDGGDITISGGDVTATGGEDGAGIGSGFEGEGGTINISGGTVTTTGGKYAAGIGGGGKGAGGNITISGGKVYAKGDVANGAYDIGTGFVGHGGTLNISGSAAVLLDNLKVGSLTPTTTTHVYRTYASKSDVPAGYSIPATWSYPIGIYEKNEAPSFTGDSTNTSQTIVLGNSLTALQAQDPNGAGNIASYTVTSGSLPTGITINNDGTFSGTASAIGNYTATIEVRDAGGLTASTTLNVMVNSILVTIAQDTTTLGYSETCTLTATTDPSGQTITWSSSDVTIAAVNPTTGEVTVGTKEGRAVIKAQTAGGFDECEVYVVDNSAPAPKPSDPVKTVSVQIKDDSGNPMVGVFVNLFSTPQTVRTDINGMAVFSNVPYNTNDPHTLVVQDALGSEIERYSLNFISGSSTGATIVGNNINVTFNTAVNNTNIGLTMVEASITGIVANVDFAPVAYQKVPNPETGYFDD